MRRLITSCFGLGWMPIAPGTWGSLPPALLFALMGTLGCSPLTLQITMGLLVVLGSLSCVAWSSAAIAHGGQEDPGEVVVDEVAGQALCFLVLLLIPSVSLAPARMMIVGGAGFLLFRIFDVFKVWPGRRLERLPAGWGILADDLLLGVYAGLTLAACLLFTEQRGETFAGDRLLSLPGALILGTFQGVTEFLPVSSSGHLVLLETLMGYSPQNPNFVLFDLAVHVGTVVAILIVFRAPFGAFVRGVTRGLRQSRDPYQLYRRNAGFRMLVLTAVGTLVTGIPGFLVSGYLMEARGSLPLLAGMWVLTGTALSLTDLRKKARRGLRQFGLSGAAIVGLAQLVAIMPGVSRSGATICAAILLCGLHRRWAVEYSMMLGAILILAAGTVQFVSNFSNLQSGSIDFLPILVGALMALAVGIPSLRLLIAASRRSCLRPFGAYCYVLAVFAMLLHLR